ncbi:sigma-70 family RNA polymerase sigma factor [Parapedobacter soli]|uniref:sigma-70 family RNA polymerase sigma factor n=1 Tax=Parapedobacter soli TaxID=416955 RepID=UPI0021CADACB|nr:sigma-70 family RNA polymerase sigma factor [Parapedobacter soli]
MDFDKLIFSVAYNMTGDYETTKDVVQDINLKFLENPIPETIADKRNYIIRTTINHCLNLKKREQRLQYKGLWLPEPFVSIGDNTNPLSKFEAQNLLSYELAFLMEQLSPTERAVFVLREAFDFSHKEISEAINISADNSRQLFSRAKGKVADIKHESVANTASLEIAKNFVSLISQGNMEALIALFNDEISLLGDGGGKAPALAKPLFGKEQIAQFFLKLIHNTTLLPEFSLTEILSQPAVVIQLNGEIICVQVLSLNENKISQIFAVLNPDKLNAFKKSLKVLSHS